MDKNLIMREAQKFAAKGLTDKALEEWNKYLSASPNDGVAHNTVGDLYLKKRATGEAVSAFRTAAEIFSKEGFHLKAMAVYKKIIAIDPNDADILAAIADLEATRGFIASANEYLARAAELYSGKGEVANTLKACQKLAELNPRDYSLKIKLAEALIKGGRSDEGVARYLEAAHACETGGNAEAAEDVYNRLAELAPHNALVVASLAKRLLSQGKTAEAVARFKPLVTPDVSDVTLLSSYGEVCLAAGNFDDAIDAAKRALYEDPRFQPAQKTLACACFKAGRSEEAVTHATPLLEEYRANQEWMNMLEVLQAWAAHASVTPEIRQKLHDVYGKLGMHPEARRELAALGNLYYESGQEQKSLNVYENLYREDPSDVTVAFRLEELRGKLGHTSDAFAITDDDIGGALMADRGEETLLANNDAVPFELENFSAVSEFSPITSDSDAIGDRPVSLSPVEEEGISLNMADFDFDLQPSGSGPVVEITEPAVAEPSMSDAIPFSMEELEAPAPPASNIPEEVLAENLDEADFYVTQGLVDDARRIYEKVLKLDPSNKRAANALASLNSGAAPSLETRGGLDIGDNSFSLDLDNDLLGEEPPAIELMADEVWSGGAGDVSTGSGLEEFLGLASEDDSAGSAITVPDEFVLEGMEMASSEIKPGSLEDEKLREAFKDFREGINQQIDAGDAETHYNLGIGYKEMGLLDEAVSEFQLTAGHPEFAVSSYTMLGHCYREAGRFDEAIAELRKGLNTPGLGEEDRCAFLYEIGEVYEMQGSVQEAVRSFESIVESNPEYRDVLARLASLKNVGLNKTSGRNQRISYL